MIKDYTEEHEEVDHIHNRTIIAFLITWFVMFGIVATLLGHMFGYISLG